MRCSQPCKLEQALLPASHKPPACVTAGSFNRHHKMQRRLGHSPAARSFNRRPQKAGDSSGIPSLKRTGCPPTPNAQPASLPHPRTLRVANTPAPLGEGRRGGGEENNSPPPQPFFSITSSPQLAKKTPTQVQGWGHQHDHEQDSCCKHHKCPRRAWAFFCTGHQPRHCMSWPSTKRDL